MTPSPPPPVHGEAALLLKPSATSKHGGFNLEDTHILRPNRLSKLVFVVAVAAHWAVVVGMTRKKTLKTKARSLLSAFKTGLRYLMT